MPDVTLDLSTILNGQPADANAVRAALQALQAAVNNVDDAQLADKAVTSPKLAPTTDFAALPAQIASLTSAWTDICTMTFTTTVNTTEIIDANLLLVLALSGTSGTSARGIVNMRLLVDGSPGTGAAGFKPRGGAEAYNSVSPPSSLAAHWAVPLAAGSHTLKVQASRFLDGVHDSATVTVEDGAMHRLSVAR